MALSISYICSHKSFSQNYSGWGGGRCHTNAYLVKMSTGPAEYSEGALNSFCSWTLQEVGGRESWEYTWRDHWLAVYISKVRLSTVTWVLLFSCVIRSLWCQKLMTSDNLITIQHERQFWIIQQKEEVETEGNDRWTNATNPRALSHTVLHWSHNRSWLDSYSFPCTELQTPRSLL